MIFVQSKKKEVQVPTKFFSNYKTDFSTKTRLLNFKMYLNKSIIVIHILCYFIIVKSDEVTVYFNDNESLENVYQSEIINTNINIQ